MRILLDCSRTIRGDDRTGIQRVVRNLANHCRRPAEAGPNQCLVIFFASDQFWLFERMLDPPRYGPNQISKPMTRMYQWARSMLYQLLPYEPMRQFLYASREGMGLTALIIKSLIFLRLNKYAGMRDMSLYKLATRYQAITPGAGDVIVAMEPFLSSAFWQRMEKARQAGAVVISVIYDLIPVTQPYWVDIPLQIAFKRWVREALMQSAAILAISEASRREAVDYLAMHHEFKRGHPLLTDSFPLGFDLDGIGSAGAVRLEIAAFFDGERANRTYLCIGIIEPRKNVSAVLDAFDLLWARGFEGRLCLIGRTGWNVESLMHRIQAHPRFNTLLFHFDSLSDSELDCAYRHSRALVFASLAEGFGLPLVEAFSRGLAVLASDMPVFREIAGERAAYFDPRIPESLARCIQQLPARDGQRTAAFSWPDWNESARIFLSKVEALAKQAQAMGAS